MEELHEKLVTAFVLSLPNYGEPFIMDTDACIDVVGVTDGVGAWSRAFSKGF